MESTVPPFDLLELYKSREVNRISTFGDIAGQLDSDELTAAYSRVRKSAPRRHDHNKTYFVVHAGLMNRAEESNRDEEHLALALWGAAQKGASMGLPDGRALVIIDYQTPLKAKLGDKGIGKVDLFGLIDGCHLAVIELKVLPANGRGDTPLRAYLEALAYCAIVEANASDIAREASKRFDKSINNRLPALIVMAPEAYWAGYVEQTSVRPWWPNLSSLAAKMDNLLGLETHFLCLRNATIRMGRRNQNPELTGHCSVVSVSELFSD